jgi:hypothetical protein
MANILARVLTHVPGLGVLCNQLLHGPEATIKALADSGMVDPHPDAVAYAKADGAKVVKLADPQAASELAAAMAEQPAEEPKVG